MKKNSTCPQSPKGRKARKGPITIGIDLGDKRSRYCVLDGDGNVVLEDQVTTSKKAMAEAFRGRSCRIALEVGTHSRWVSQLLQELGHEVIVANARKLQLISRSSRKDDRLDARLLAKLAKADPELLCPIRHRSEKAQADLMKIRVRAALVETRTSLINTVRGLAKAAGERVEKCDADALSVKKVEKLPQELQQGLKPLLQQIESLTQQIKACDRELEQIARNKYPETELLMQVNGVGTLIALTFVLTVEDGHRFHKSRDVGCYLGLRPKRSDSGESEPQLRITKEGDRYLRKLLVQGAQHILGWRGPDSDLRRWGMKLAARGGKNAKKRAIVAVARKLAILLHLLWVNGEVYEPLRNSQAGTSQQAA